MRLARVVRTTLPFLIPGLAGLVLGCSGPPEPPPVDKAEGKKIVEDMKRAHKEQKADQAKAKVGPSMKVRHRRKAGS